MYCYRPGEVGVICRRQVPKGTIPTKQVWYFNYYNSFCKMQGVILMCLMMLGGLGHITELTVSPPSGCGTALLSSSCLLIAALLSQQHSFPKYNSWRFPFRLQCHYQSRLETGLQWQSFPLSALVPKGRRMTAIFHLMTILSTSLQNANCN